MSKKTNWLKKIVLALLKRAGLLVLVLLGAGVGFLVHAAVAPPGAPMTAETEGGEAKKEYTCSMHPQVRSTDPNGICPLCEMDLIPVETGQGSTGSLREYRVSPEAAALMDIQVAKVQRKFVTAEIRMVGKVDYDETKLAYITAWMPGRLDRLYIDYTGIPVKKGDHLVWIYSPELFSAQEELLDALDVMNELTDQSLELQRDFARTTLAAARDKLRLLGLSKDQIDKVESSGKVEDHQTIYSPASGIVIHKNAQEGMYVTTGTRIYTIADLTTMWVKLDAYESDLMWLHYGQKVDFTTEAHPGKRFSGTISFIDPILTDRTRTVKVRLVVPNKDEWLKPGMFVRAIARPRVAKGGKVMDASLAGKWISPHHPEVIEDGPGKCRICKIPLVRAEDLGYVSANATEAEKPLVIPVTAALVTGTRAVVYVRIDASLLNLESVSDWPELIANVKAHLKAPAPGKGRFINITCPIMGGDIEADKVTSDLIADFKGRKVAFCCAACPPKWNKLSEAGKARAIATVTGSKTPLMVFWKMLSPELRSGLLAVKRGRRPEAPLQHRFMREVNEILETGDLYAKAVWPIKRLGGEAQALIKIGPDKLRRKKLKRLNRLLLGNLFPKSLPAGRGAVAFEGRQVVLGPRAGDHYLVRSGLAEGELVVTRGSFKIDSALQLLAKPSMMGRGAAPPPMGHAGHGKADKSKGKSRGKDKDKMTVPDKFKHPLHLILAVADEVAAATKAGDHDKARAAFAKLEPAVKAADKNKTMLEAKAAKLWLELAGRLISDGVVGSGTVTERDAQRAAKALKDSITDLRKQMGLTHGGHAAATSKPAVHTPARPAATAFEKQLGALYAAYFTMQRSLAADKFDAALAAASAGKTALDKVEMKLVKGKDHTDWMPFATALDKILTGAAGAKDIKVLRESFALYSVKMTALARRFGPPAGGDTYLMHCPMALGSDRGAIWLQDNKELRNPYYGAAMPTCGEIQGTLPPTAEGKKKDGDHGTRENH